jgi:hypothetical protein
LIFKPPVRRSEFFQTLSSVIFKHLLDHKYFPKVCLISAVSFTKKHAVSILKVISTLRKEGSYCSETFYVPNLTASHFMVQYVSSAVW